MLAYKFKKWILTNFHSVQRDGQLDLFIISRCVLHELDKFHTQCRSCTPLVVVLRNVPRCDGHYEVSKILESLSYSRFLPGISDAL
jgi:hypothetical protein